MIVERVDTFSDINIAYKSLEDLYGTLIFMLDTDDIAMRIRDLQPNIESAEVSRLYPDGAKIVLASSEPAFRTYVPQEDRTYVITENGVLIAETEPNIALSSFEIIDPEFFETGFFDHRRMVDAETMRTIVLLSAALSERFSDFPAGLYRYFPDEREVHVFLESGTVLIFEIHSSIERQLSVLRFLRDARRSVLADGTTIYVDLRNLNKLFLCREKPVCQGNLVRIYGEVYADL